MSTREDGIISDIGGMAAVILSQWLVSVHGHTTLTAEEQDIGRAMSIAKRLYFRSRQAVRELQAEGDYGPIAGAKEVKP